MEEHDYRIAVVGLGYVGLPLAVELGKRVPTIGFDINANRVLELQAGKDCTLEVTADELAAARQLACTTNSSDLASCNVYIVTVPTPIDDHQQPDLSPLRAASETIARLLTPGDLVVYESTVYPGVTEDVCVPILESISNLRFNEEFFVGYSPERINPGDKDHRLPHIAKVVAGSTPKAAERVARLYELVVTAGVHRASSIKVAEAAKVIENTQRDVNIALVNELAMLFARLDIDTEEVLRAAGTKWNFLPFRPGLVGGHCIGVDPYYLAHKAAEVGFHPAMILAGRRINDGMGPFIVDQVTRLMTRRRIHVVDSRVLILGLAFKENCPDTRNTRVVDIIRGLRDLHIEVDVWDSWVPTSAAKALYGIDLVTNPQRGTYDAIVLAVAHNQFRDLGVDEIRRFGKDPHVLYDVKHIFDAASVDGRL